MPNPGPFTYWYLQVPNLILLALAVLLLVRLVLTPFAAADGGPVRLLHAVTQPVVVAVGAITPRLIPQAGVIVCAILWLIVARVLLLMAALAMGARM